MFNTAKTMDNRWDKNRINQKINLPFWGLVLSILLISLNTYAQPLAASKSKFVGNIISNGYNIRTNFLTYWNQVTAENAGKWGSVEGTQGSYNWGNLDMIYNYAVANNLPYKHHNLVWGNQQPGFLSSLDSSAQYQEVENWIKLSGQRYPLSDMCDVVNEPLHAVPVYKNALGGSGKTGWDWVIKTFELARQYWSPTCKLILNEYNVLNDANAATNFVQIINLLKVKGLIDGIGIQAHSFEVNGPSLSTLKANLDKIGATGLPIYISEFDINESNDNTQLQKYKQVFPLLYEHPSVKGITLWGYTKNEIWQTAAYLITDQNVERPAMVWLRNYLIAPFKPTPISPVSGTVVTVIPKLVWSASDSATAYHVQLSLSSSFTTTIIDSTVSDTTFQCDSLATGTAYYWRVNSSNSKGTSDYCGTAYFNTEGTQTSVENLKVLEANFNLAQNYPNPFNPTTNITFTLPQNSNIHLYLINMLGQIVKEIANGNYSAGTHNVNLNASDLASGVYCYRLEAGTFAATKKMIIMK